MPLVFSPDGWLPEGIHAADLAEVRAALVDAFGTSSTRAGIYEHWLEHRKALEEFVTIEAQWLDGSFVTDKVDPGDVDIITFLDAEEILALPTHRQILVQGLVAGHYTRDLWRCDSFPIVLYPPGHPNHDAAIRERDEWATFFARVRDRSGAKKGLVEVVL